MAVDGFAADMTVLTSECLSSELVHERDHPWAIVYQFFIQQLETYVMTVMTYSGAGLIDARTMLCT